MKERNNAMKKKTTKTLTTVFISCCLASACFGSAFSHEHTETEKGSTHQRTDVKEASKVDVPAESKAVVVKRLKKYSRALRKAQEEERKLLKEIDSLTKEYGRYKRALEGSQGLKGAGKDASQIVAERNLPRVELTLEEKKNQLPSVQEDVERCKELVASEKLKLAKIKARDNDGVKRPKVQKR